MSEVLDFKINNEEEIIEQEKNNVEYSNDQEKDALYDKNSIVYPQNFIETYSEIYKGTDITKFYLRLHKMMT
jgi:hypothetical protein